MRRVCIQEKRRELLAKSMEWDSPRHPALSNQVKKMETERIDQLLDRFVVFVPVMEALCPALPCCPEGAFFARGGIPLRLALAPMYCLPFMQLAPCVIPPIMHLLFSHNASEVRPITSPTCAPYWSIAPD